MHVINTQNCNSNKIINTSIVLYSYQAYNGENVVLLAGLQLPTNQFTMVTDPYILSLLQPQVKNEIVQVREHNKNNFTSSTLTAVL